MSIPENVMEVTPGVQVNAAVEGRLDRIGLQGIELGLGRSYEPHAGGEAAEQRVLNLMTGTDFGSRSSKVPMG